MAIKKLFYYFFASRALVLVFASVAPLYIPLREGYLGEIVWSNFDGRHFLEIVTIGYRRFNFVYLPLYPFMVWLMKVVIPIAVEYLGTLISLLAFGAGIWLLFKIASMSFDKKTADLAVLFMVIFPTSFFYNSVYSVSLVFLLLTSSFLAARRKKWFWASVWAGIATASHITALAIVPALFAEWIVQKRKPLNFIPYGVLSLLGIVSYLAYLQIKFGNWFLFMSSFAGWHTRMSLIFPLRTVYRYLKMFLSVDPRLIVYWIAVLEFVTFILLLYLAIVVWKQVRASYAILILGILLISSMSGSFIGIARYFLFLFPAYMGLAVIASRKGWIRVGLSILFVVLSAVLTGLFVRGYFVA